jgi:hypothetical protein
MTLKLQPRQAVLGGIACIVVVYASLVSAIYTSRRDERAADSRHADAAQLASVPPVPIATLTAELEAAKASLAWVQGAAALSSIDPASDEATALLVRRAQDARLTVTGIARLDTATTTVDGTAYSVDAVRMSIEAASPDAIVDFVRRLEASDPGLVPTLSALTAGEGAGASAEIVFSAYREMSATPAAGAGAAP